MEIFTADNGHLIVPIKLWKKIMKAMGSGNDQMVVKAWIAAKEYEEKINLK